MADFISALTGVQMDQALMDMAEHNSEAYAVGERNGIAVASDDVTYHNNARYYAQIASSQIVGDASSAVRWDTDQSEALTDAQKAQARENINAASDSDVVKITAQTLTTAQQSQARANIMAGGSNRNLLDNPWFTVNQREATSGTHTTMPADRWKATYGSGSVNWTRESDGCITFAPTNAASHGDIYQRIPDEIYDALAGTDKTVTVSVMMQDGTIYSGTSYLPTTNTRAYIDVRNVGGTSSRIVVYVQASTKQLFVQAYYGSLTVKAVKLELGSVSTLANDAPPNYAEELEKCQRYFYRWYGNGSAVPVGHGFGTQSTYARILIPIPVTMRRPTQVVSYSGGGWYLCGNASIISVTNITFAYPTQNGLVVNVYASVVVNQVYSLMCNGNTTSYIDISADL